MDLTLPKWYSTLINHNNYDMTQISFCSLLMLSDNDFLIYQHLKPQEISDQIFANYNNANSDHPINAFDNVNYCLAVKK